MYQSDLTKPEIICVYKSCWDTLIFFIYFFYLICRWVDRTGICKMKYYTVSGSEEGVSEFCGKTPCFKTFMFSSLPERNPVRVSWFRVDLSLKTVLCICAHASVIFYWFGLAIIFSLNKHYYSLCAFIIFVYHNFASLYIRWVIGERYRDTETLKLTYPEDT